MKDKPNKLDDIIRERLGDLGAPYRPETWDWLSDRLDQVDEPVDQVDGLVRDKLANLGAAYRPETWDWLSERLEEIGDGAPAGAEMQMMDEAIYESMHRLEKPYDPNHWPLLLKKLEGNAYVGKQIVRYKAMEISLLVLLLITFIRLPGNYTDLQPQAVPAAVPERPQALRQLEDNSAPASVSNTDVLAALEERGPASDQQVASAGRTTGAATAVQEQAAASAPVIMPGIYATTAAAAARYLGVPAPSGSMPDIARLPMETKELAIPPYRELPITASDHALADNELPLVVRHSGNLFDVLAYLPATIIKPFCQTCVGRKLDKEALEARQPTFFRIGMQGGPDYNRVITPPIMIEGDIYQADRYSLGYGGGLTFGLEKGRWELETGLIYSSKRYFPLPVVVLDGSVEDGFFGNGTKQFDLEVFQVPLNFRYNFIRRNRWRVYALGGMSWHLTTQSNYYLAEAEGFESESFRPVPTKPGQTPAPRNAPSIKAEFDNFTKGWLQGGSFNKNSYISGSVGVGIERFITDYWSIYAQPTYSHSLIFPNAGLGPYYDRIHTNSVIFGVKVRLR